MTKYKDTFEFKLTKPIKYQTKISDSNTFADCSTLILKAPNIKKHYRIGNVLQALLTPAMFKSYKTINDLSKSFKNEKIQTKLSKKEEEEQEEGGNRIIIKCSILELKEDINNFYDKFEELLTTDGICCLENDIPFTEAELNSIDYNDFKDLVREYILNFFIVSWMKSLG